MATQRKSPQARASALARALAQPRDVTQLHLAKKDLVELPAEVAEFEKLAFLDLAENHLTTLPDWLDRLPIRKLDLTHNPFRDVPTVVTRLTELVELRLRCHHLERLPPELGQLQKLKLLLAVSRVLGPPVEMLAELSNLRCLTLCDVALRELPRDLGRLTALEELWIEWTALRSLPDTLCSLPKLHTIMASGSLLEALPEAISDLPALETLDLSAQKHLTALPSRFGRLAKLRKLRLETSHVLDLPDSMGDLRALRTLTFGMVERQSRVDAALEKVSAIAGLEILGFTGPGGPLQVTPRVFQMPALTLLTLFQWSLTLPELTVPNTTLTRLVMRSCKLDALPASFENLQGLEQVYLESNAFRAVPEVLSKLPRLTHIHLRDNLVGKIPTWATERGIQVSILA